MYSIRLSSIIVVFVALAACSNDALSPTQSSPTTGIAPELIQEGEGIFQRYVAIGTSISMGVASDGVYAASQQSSWPAQLARLAHRDLSLPLIQAPGCSAPFAAPLVTGKRTNGESAGLPFLQRACMPNEAGVTLPAGNVAIDGARTGQALTATPENPDPGHATQYPRVLAPGQSQVTANRSPFAFPTAYRLAPRTTPGTSSAAGPTSTSSAATTTPLTRSLPRR